MVLVHTPYRTSSVVNTCMMGALQNTVLPLQGSRLVATQWVLVWGGGAYNNQIFCIVKSYITVKRNLIKNVPRDKSKIEDDTSTIKSINLKRETSVSRILGKRLGRFAEVHYILLYNFSKSGHDSLSMWCVRKIGLR